MRRACVSSLAQRASRSALSRLRNPRTERQRGQLPERKMSLAEELDLLRDVRRAAMRQAAVRLPESFDCELLQVAQQAAKNFYGTDERPVWAADVTLTAGHLARRRESMDPRAYAVIVRDMGRLYCHRKTAARAKTIELVVECRSDEHEWARAGLGR